MDVKSKKIGVLCGGDSLESDVSIVSANHVYERLVELGYKVTLINLSEPRFLVKLSKIDVAFIAMHGAYGEDGKIQGLLDIFKIPYTGSGVYANALGMDKLRFKQFLDSIDVETPRYAKNFKNHGLEYPVIVKPVHGGSSMGVNVVRGQEDLHKLDLSDDYAPYFAEEFIEGVFISVAITGEYGRVPQILTPLKVDYDSEFYDTDTKLNGGFKYSAANISHREQLDLDIICTKIYNLMGANGFIRVDFIYKEGKFYVLEVNTIPGLSKTGNLQQCCQYSGVSYDQMIEHILFSAYTKPQYMA